MSLLSLKNLNVGFERAGRGASLRMAARDVSFVVETGSVTALVGESGAGKSITARAIPGLLPKGALVASGDILFRGGSLLNLPPDKLRKLRGNGISMMFQDPLAGLNPLHMVGRQIAESMLVHKTASRRQARRRVLELLELVNIDRPEERSGAYPHQLSGGQRQRVMLAMAIANKPDLLIADEPTTALDATMQLEVLELLNTMRRDLRMAVLLISHDLSMVRALADTVCVMRDGSIVESAPCQEIFRAPKHEYTRILLGKPLPPRTDAPTGGEEIFAIRGLRVSYARSSVHVFRRPTPFEAVSAVSFSLRQGECLGIVGESGSGKSSLALAALRLIRSTGGIEYQGRSLQAFSHKEMQPLRRNLQVIFQDPFTSLNPRMSVGECIAEGLRVFFPEQRVRQLRYSVAATLEEVGLPPAYADRFPHELSGGERQRVAIGRALILQPAVLFLDEPTSSLDRALQFQIMELLRALQERHKTACVYISHDLVLVRQFCHSVLVLQHGRCVETGSVEQVFSNPETAYMKRLLTASGLGEGAY